MSVSLDDVTMLIVHSQGVDDSSWLLDDFIQPFSDLVVLEEDMLFDLLVRVSHISSQGSTFKLCV